MTLLWLVCGRLCKLVCDCLWNVQKIVFRGYLDEEKKFGLLRACLANFMASLTACLASFYARVKGLFLLF